MLLKANDTIARMKNGKFVVAFTVSPQEHREFIEWLGENKECMVNFEPYFGEATKGQKNFFHKYLRKLAEKMRMTFEETKVWFITEYGFPEEKDGEYCFVTIDASTHPKERFKKKNYYFKALEEDGGEVKYLTYRGVSLLDSREMNLMLDYLKEECREQGISIISDKEYEKLKSGWGNE